MDEAPLDSSMSDYAESSAAAMYSRNDDPMTRALRSEGTVGIAELINLNRQTTPCRNDGSSSATPTTAALSSHKPSTMTKPTSAGTSYPVESYVGKGKTVATYASSLSATHGSSSDNEVETIRETTLIGVGDWTTDMPGSPHVLKGSARVRKRPRPIRRIKHKKPVVIIQQDNINAVSDEDDAPATSRVASRNGKDAKYLRRRRSMPQHDQLDRGSVLRRDQLDLAEQGLINETPTVACPPAAPGLSRARIYLLIGLGITIVLTIAMFALAAHHTGKGRMNCTKGLIFAGTVLISCFTVLAMVVARRALLEALLAGVLEFLIGFALVIEIHEFM